VRLSERQGENKGRSQQTIKNEAQINNVRPQHTPQAQTKETNWASSTTKQDTQQVKQTKTEISQQQHK
jgi:hypothetical protein